MSTVIPYLRLTRAGIFIVLAGLIALLGVAAKHSQFDGPPQRGYLSKAVKMEGGRVQPDTGSEWAQGAASTVAEVFLAASEPPVMCAPLMFSFTPVSLSSPPLLA